jgi:hypothetical protein
VRGSRSLVTVRSGGTCGVWAVGSEPFLLVVRRSGTSVQALVKVGSRARLQSSSKYIIKWSSRCPISDSIP